MERWKPFIVLCRYGIRFPRDIAFCFIRIGFWDRSWRLYGLPLIQKHHGSVLEIGSQWTACSHPAHNSLGVFQKVTIKCFRGATLRIGNRVGMSGVSISCTSSIFIGDDVLIGSGALIADHDAHPLFYADRNDPSKIRRAPIRIEDGAFIGARAIILKGVTIGRGAVVGAGSVVSRDVTANTIVAGNPAKLIRHFSNDSKMN